MANIKNYLKFLPLMALFYLLPASVIASVNDSSKSTIDTSAVYYYSLKEFDSVAAYITTKHIDTSIIGFQYSNPSDNISLFITSIGNIGLIERRLYHVIPDISFFESGRHFSTNYIFKPDNVNYFISHKPFTNVYYSTGGKREQVFRINQSLPFKNGFYLGADYLIVNSIGREFFRQKSANEHLALSSEYRNNKNTYIAKASYIHNKIKFQENGGITDDVLFEYRDDKKENPPYYLNDAETRLKETYLSLNQYYYVSGKSNLSDSLNEDLKEYLNNKFIIAHSFHYKRSWKVFDDKTNSQALYPNSFLNSSHTYDSSFLSSVNNKLSVILSFKKNDSVSDYIKLKFGIGHEITKWDDYHTDTSFNGFQPFLKINFFPLRKTILDFNIKTQVLGYTSGDLECNLSLKYQVNPDKSNFLKADFKFSQVEPDWIYRQILTNHFLWENNFYKQKFIQAGAGFYSQNISAGFSYTNIRDALYFDIIARPKQMSVPVNLLSARINASFNLGDFLLHNSLLFNYVANYDVLRYPLVQDVIEVSWGRTLFKSALSFRTGVNVAWNTSYYALAYNPATGIFHLQNSTSIGNYPYGDFFVNFKIKRARIFVKYRHFNSGWTGMNYYDSPHYPSPESAVKFGVSWMFHD